VQGPVLGQVNQILLFHVVAQDGQAQRMVPCHAQMPVQMRLDLWVIGLAQPLRVMAKVFARGVVNGCGASPQLRSARLG
jgi:hypothetical protein